MEFKKGDVVKVKKGTKVEGVNIDLGGWHGRIGISEYEDPSFVLLELDSIVLKNLPEDYIINTLRITNDLNHFYLYKNDVEISTARDTQADVDIVLKEINGKYWWKVMSNGSPEEDLIAEVLENIDDKNALYVWEEYLEENLNFPFKVRITEADFRSPHRVGITLKVYSIADSDDHYGIIVRGKKMRKTVHYPLCDLEVIDQKDPNHIPVRAYVIWFANR